MLQPAATLPTPLATTFKLIEKKKKKEKKKHQKKYGVPTYSRNIS